MAANETTLSEFDPLATAEPLNEKPVSPVKQEDSDSNKLVSITLTDSLGSHDSHVTNTTSATPTIQSTDPTSHDNHVTTTNSDTNLITPTTSNSHGNHVTNSTVSHDSHVTPPKQPHTGDYIPLSTEQTVHVKVEPNSIKPTDIPMNKPHPQSHVTMTMTNQNAVLGTSSSADKIGAEISEIDSFLKSLKMSQFDALSPSLGQPLPQQQVPLPPKQEPLPRQQEPLLRQQVKEEVPNGNEATSKVSSTKKESTPIKSAGLRLIGQLVSGDSGSSSDSDSSSGSSDDEPIIIHERVGRGDGSDSEGDTSKANDRHGYPKIKGEIDYRDLPSEDCNVPFPEDGTLLPIGKISHYAEKLVVIQALPNTPPIDEGTILWSKDKKSIAKVFETFGPVKTPLYSVKVESEDHASSLGLTLGSLVYVIPGNLDLTRYVFTQQLLKQKGSDASWKNDSEVPEQFKDYSDDESEHAKKRKHSSKRQRGQDKTLPASKQSQTTSSTTTSSSQQNSTHQYHTPKTTTPGTTTGKLDYSYNPKMSSYFPRGTTLLSPGALPPGPLPPAMPPRQHPMTSQYPMTIPSSMSGGYGLQHAGGQGQIYPQYPPVPGVMPPGYNHPGMIMMQQHQSAPQTQGYSSYGINMMDYASHYFHQMQQGQPQMPTTGSVAMTTTATTQSQSRPPTSS